MAPARTLLAFALLVAASQGAEDEACKKRPDNWPQRPPRCCDIPFPLDKMKQHFGECARRFGRPTSAVPTAKAVFETRMCIEDCVFKATGYSKEGSDHLEKDTLSSELIQGVPPQWKEAMQAALNQCLETHGKPSGEGSTCSNAPHDFTFCTMRKLFLTCPKDLWNDSAECNLVKERMELCPSIPPPPPAPPAHLAGRQGGPPPFPSQFHH